jgi:molybdenum cofactor cytidylyltransferase
MNNEGVVLAAGMSSRMGEFKMSMLIDRKPLIEHTISSLLQVCSRVIVVSGHCHQVISDLVGGLAKVEVIFNPDYRKGMFTSVKVGVAQLRARQCFIMPGDCPLVSSLVFHRLLQIEEEIAVPTYSGRMGHPLLLPHRFHGELLHEPDDSNLRAFIERKGFVKVAVDDEGILLDLDTREDFGAAKARVERSQH